MNYNFNLLIAAANKQWSGSNPNLIQLEYAPDNVIRASKGDVSYYFDYEKVKLILQLNEVDLHNEKTVYDVLGKHLANQLSASMGSKIFPEIKSHSSDFI